MRDLFVKLYSDPVALIERTQAERGFWQRAWLSCASMWLGGLALAAVAAALSGSAALFVGSLILPLALLMPCIVIALNVAKHARLWLLYLFAPPALLAALLAGTSLLWPAAGLLSGVLITPVLVGLLLSCACAVDVHNQISRLRREQIRQRQAGRLADLATPSYQNRARAVRLVTAGAGVGLAILAQLLYAQANSQFSVTVGLSLVIFAGACIRAEATLRCWLGEALVAPDGYGIWRATYAGRWALFVPIRSLEALLRRGGPPAESGAALKALLQEGALGPPIRRAVARLSVDEAAQVALGLSLQPGVTSVMQYLAPAWPTGARCLALMYARLATESTRPTGLQRWIAALDEPCSDELDTMAEPLPRLTKALETASVALQCSTYDPALADAIDRLHHLILTLYPDAVHPTASDAGWPEALMKRLIAQERLLRHWNP